MNELHKIANPEARAWCQAAVADVYRVAYRVQGRRAFESTPRCAALHEAGHALVFQATVDLVRWWPPYRVRIFRHPDSSGLDVWLGSTDVSPKAPPISAGPGDEEGNLVWALRCVAGVAAEMIFDARDFRMGSSADELAVFGGMVRNLAVESWHCDPAPVFIGLFNAVSALLRTHERQVMAVAASLERTRNIGPVELRRLLRGVPRYDWRSLRRLKPSGPPCRD